MSGKTLLTALFFFKVLGFSKPPDAAIRVLSNCDCGRISIMVCMGSQGLTRLSMLMLQEYEVPEMVSTMCNYIQKDRLSRALDSVAINDEDLEDIENEELYEYATERSFGNYLKRHPKFLEFGADMVGFYSGLGY